MPHQRRQKKSAFPRAAPAPIVNIAESRSHRDALQPARKVGIFFAVPTESGQINFTVAMAFARAMAYNADPSCPFQFTVHIEAAKKGIDYARNCIVKKFLNDSDCDWLLMVDDDEVIPENFWQLCTVRDSDVVGALIPVWVANMDPAAMLRVNNYGVDDEHRCYNLPMPDMKLQQPYRVPVVGTGAIAVRRRVFAPRPHGLGDAPFYFTYMDDRKVRGGEDVNFSVDCQRLGFQLAVHPAVKFDHMKNLALWQIEAYYQARKAREAAGQPLTDAERLSIG